jgi:hypothetical protein
MSKISDWQKLAHHESLVKGSQAVGCFNTEFSDFFNKCSKNLIETVILECSLTCTVCICSSFITEFRMLYVV